MAASFFMRIHLAGTLALAATTICNDTNSPLVSTLQAAGYVYAEKYSSYTAGCFALNRSVPRLVAYFF